jgi:acyl transferase domain-containing protein
MDGIAVIGLAGRFPGAPGPDRFWENLKSGVESISRFTVEELEVSNAAALAKNPNFVMARPILDDVDLFDAAFFGVYPKEAELMDPQHRVFLECCWEAFENAGYNPLTLAGPAGVFAGCSGSTYFLSQVCRDRPFIEEYVRGYQVENYPAMMGSNLDFLATRVAYKLNLKGPSFSLVAGCSTSLIAVCLACQNLLHYQCDYALAGGVSITFPQKRGYVYQEGGMVSPDGHCRTFDVKAQGTVFGSGAAVVLLKRLEQALADGDHIYAVIKGSALNNDGAAKVGYTAPSIEGQARVIAMGMASAGVSPETINYVEVHGTATPLGDPIELAALTQAFRARTRKKGFCALGTAKTNVGHLDIASGATGLIKTVLSLHHKQLPPVLHFTKPNPKFDLENSPFYVNATLAEWKAGPAPRRAGVSAFGVGGTNAHVVLEEAPAVPASPPARPLHLVLWSARSKPALDTAAANLARHFREHPEVDFADAAYTLQVGRRAFACRAFAVCRDAAEASAVLEKPDSKRLVSGSHDGKQPSVVFMFPGQGAQSVNMGSELYRLEAAFREEVDHCAELLRLELDFDLREALFPPDGRTKQAEELLGQTRVTQPALFVVEYALARLWMSWGVKPQAMIGHSVGEYVAGCLAGVFSLPDALRIVARRAALVQAQPAGSMLAVKLSAVEAAPLLDGSLSLAAINSPRLCVVSGPTPAIQKLAETLTAKSVACRGLSTSHAFHSAMMNPVMEPLIELIKTVTLHAPRIPYVSNVTGRWITAAEACNPVYWAGHVRDAVRFADGLEVLLKDPNRVLLEVGPGQTLSTFARQHPQRRASVPVLPSLPLGNDQASTECASLLNALGKLWLAGQPINWKGFYGHENRRRTPLPTYPFERQRFWIDTPKPVSEQPSQILAPKNQSVRPGNGEPTGYEGWNASGNGNDRPAKVKETPRASERATLAPSLRPDSNPPGANHADEGFPADLPLEEIMEQQLELMKNQLDLLRSSAANPE